MVSGPLQYSLDRRFHSERQHEATGKQCVCLKGTGCGLYELTRHNSAAHRCSLVRTIIVVTSRRSSPPSGSLASIGSSNLIAPFETTSRRIGTSNSRTPGTSLASTPNSSTLSELALKLNLVEAEIEGARLLLSHTTNPVGGGTSARAPPMPGPAGTGMFASNANLDRTPLAPARTERIDISEGLRSRRPRYARGMLWSDTGPDIMTVAESTLYHPPMPAVPDTELADPVVNATLRDHPHLFRIVTPINVDRFEHLLKSHPNRPFVDSVVRGLREGFWPWAERPEEYPITWDESRPPPSDAAAAAFLETQRQEELDAGRFSCAFGPDLLPGMYCMPVHAVPKPHSDKMRLVTNHSAGAYSLNSMIPRESISGVILDGIPALGQALRRIRQSHQRPLIMWKSDVSHAYRLLPMSPYWQIKQVVTINGRRHVDHCNVFGNRGSQRIWNAFISLVIWIVIEMHLILLLGYVDDNFGTSEADELEYYEPYGYYYPRAQVCLLRVWDELGIPHEFKKQVYGPVIPIIGFAVDPNAMTVTMTADSKATLLEAIDNFCGPPGSRPRRTLREFLSLAGYANWAFNVFPLLKPSLSNLYAKTRGKDKMNATLHVNLDLIDDLKWLHRHVQASNGVHFFGAEEWGVEDLTPSNVSHELVYVDASGSGLGIYFPWLGCGYFSEIPPEAPDGVIFFTEALTACAAIHKIVDFVGAGRCIKRLGVFSDNTNTVHIFNSLRAQPEYNAILRSAVEVRIRLDLDVRVSWIPGADNQVADALSRRDFMRARELHPDLNILPFIPPQDALGESKK